MGVSSLSLSLSLPLSTNSWLLCTYKSSSIVIAACSCLPARNWESWKDQKLEVWAVVYEKNPLIARTTHKIMSSKIWVIQWRARSLTAPILEDKVGIFGNLSLLLLKSLFSGLGLRSVDRSSKNLVMFDQLLSLSLAVRCAVVYTSVQSYGFSDDHPIKTKTAYKKTYMFRRDCINLF